MYQTLMPEIAERDATGDIATTYVDIRQTLGVPVVNYIWRSLAAVDGLPWAWPHVKAWRYGIATAAPKLRADAGTLAREHGLRPQGPDAVPPPARDVIRAYERGNSWNLLAVSMLVAARQGGPMPTPPTEGSDPGADGRRPIAPYPDHDSLPRDVREMISKLAEAGPGRDSGVRPSLWVHLAPWPEVLAQLAESLPPILASRPFAEAHQVLLMRAPAYLSIDAAALQNNRDNDAVHATLRAFRGRIAEMVLVGAAIG